MNETPIPSTPKDTSRQATLFGVSVQGIKGTKWNDGNGADGKHYWLTPPELMADLQAEFNFDFDPCPYPKPDHFDGLTCEWGQSNYVNPPFGSVIHEGKKKGPTAWVRKAIAENQKGKRVVLVYPIDKWILMLLAAGAKVRNLGDVKWCATENGEAGKGTGRHIAAFILEPSAMPYSSDGRPNGISVSNPKSVAMALPSPKPVDSDSPESA